MNKYQEALDYLAVNSSSLLINQGNKDTELMNWHYESRDLLQELVDKETPMKVDKTTKGSFPNYDNYETSHITYKCPKCNCTIHLDWHEKRNFCAECGVKLDWSDEE